MPTDFLKINFLYLLFSLFCGCVQPQPNTNNAKDQSKVSIVSDTRPAIKRNFERRFVGTIGKDSVVMYLWKDYNNSLWTAFRASYYFVKTQEVYCLFGEAYNDRFPRYAALRKELDSLDAKMTILFLANDVANADQDFTFCGDFTNDSYKGIFKKGNQKIPFQLLAESRTEILSYKDTTFTFASNERSGKFRCITNNTNKDSFEIILNITGLFVDTNQYLAQSKEWSKTISPFLISDALQNTIFDFDKICPQAPIYTDFMTKKDAKESYLYLLGRHIYTLYNDNKTIATCFFEKKHNQTQRSAIPYIHQNIRSFDKQTLKRIYFKDLFLKGSESEMAAIIRKKYSMVRKIDLDEFIVTNKNIQYLYFKDNHIQSSVKTIVLPLNEIKHLLKANPYLY